MEFNRLAVIGIGSVRCGHPIVSSLAGYFGERSLEIAFFDADAERLDLYHRLAEAMFNFNRCTHTVTATQDPGEALEGAERIIIATSDHCAGKLLGLPSVTPEDKQKLTESLLAPITDGQPILNLLGAEFSLEEAWNIAWPPQMSESDRVSTPHQVLRFIHGEEYPYTWLTEFDRSPLKLWLDNPASIPQNGLQSP